MNVLAKIIDQAVASAMEKHPKLFVAKESEKAQKTLSREIMRSLTRAPSDAETEAELSATQSTGQSIPLSDERAIAYCQLRKVAGAVEPFSAIPDQIFLPPEADVTCVRVFANCPPQSEWPFVTKVAQLTAWNEFFGETLPGVSRRPITQVRNGVTGALLPWPWPPSKTGKIYEPEEEIPL